MCGVAMVYRAGRRTDVSEEVLDRMTTVVAHRGPDGAGLGFFGASPDSSGTVEVDPRSGDPWCLGLGHRRLSILDLSTAGRQPMQYRDLWVTFNGEVYNYVELRRELELLGHTFRSSTDTEVVLAAYAEWGVDCFRRFHGMWGLVLVDGTRNVAVLARDRVGIKPLYVYEDDGVVAACSEIKQLTVLPRVRLRPDADAVVSYITNGYEDPSQTMFLGVAPLPAGTWCELDLRNGHLGEPKPYWHPESVVPTVSDPGEAAGIFREVFQRSMQMHLRSDVPVGCALSGGLDSSTIAAATGPASDFAHGFHTFSVTFPGEPFDERRYVDDVVARTDSLPHFVTPTGEGLVAELDQFVWSHDEPVRSVAQYAAYALARLTRAQGVPVTLNGQGGDEIFSAYWQAYFSWLRRLGRGDGRARLARELITAGLPGGNNEVWRTAPSMARRYLRRQNLDSAVTVLGPHRRATTNGHIERAASMTWQEWRVYEVRDFTFPRLLKWDDRNFMAFSVEGRYPFLDHAVIESCLSFLPSALYGAGWTKLPLRRAYADELPSSVATRKSKVGFETPQGQWLRGALAPLLANLVEGDSPVWEYVDQQSARSLAKRISPKASDQDESAQVLLRLLLADRWMQVFGLQPGNHSS